MTQHSAKQQPRSEPVTAERPVEASDTGASSTRVPALSVWQAVAFSVIVLVFGLGLLDFLQLIVRPLALLFAAIVIAEALSPIVDRIAMKLPRVIAVIIPYIILLAVIGGVGWLVFPTLVSEAQRLVNRGPELFDQFRDWLNRTDPTGDGRIVDMLTSRLGQASGALANIPFTIVSSIIDFFLVLAMSIYWLIAKPSLRGFVLSLFPDRRRDDADKVLNEMGHTIGGYVRAQLMTALLIAVLTYTGLSIIGVEYAIVLGVIAGLGELVPVLGPFVAAAPAVAVALLTSPIQAVIVAGFFVVLQQVESNILLPNLMHQQADIPPLLAIFSLFVGGSVGGILGALVAVPLAGALKVLVIRVLAPATRHWSGADHRTRSTSTEEEP